MAPCREVLCELPARFADETIENQAALMLGCKQADAAALQLCAKKNKRLVEFIKDAERAQ